MHEFEKHPQLAEQIQEYASFGRFGDWQKFTDILNEALKQASKNLIKADVIKQVCKCGNQLTEKELFYETCLQCNDVVIAN